MPLVKVASLSRLPVDSVTEVTADDQIDALGHTGGRVTALNKTCLHRGVPLGQGNLSANRVAHPWHGREWDCQTATSDFDPTPKIPTFEVHVEGDAGLLDVLDRA
jgi:nitrite reductase/ring-hydroxylating ferredoxin subunit